MTDAGDSTLLYDCLLLGTLLFGVGLTGFLARRQLIVMLASAACMVQGTLVAVAGTAGFFGDSAPAIWSVGGLALLAAASLPFVPLVAGKAGADRGDDVCRWTGLRDPGMPAIGGTASSMPGETPPHHSTAGAG